METDTIRRRQFCIYAKVVQMDRIVARGSLLGLFAEGSHRFDGVFTGEGQQSHITQVTNTRTGEVRMTKAIDLAVILMIPAAGIPTHDMGIRTQLHHGKGARSTREGMSMKSRTDERIDIHQLISKLIRSRRLLATDHSPQKQHREEKCFLFHCLSDLVYNLIENRQNPVCHKYR